MKFLFNKFFYLNLGLIWVFGFGFGSGTYIYLGLGPGPDPRPKPKTTQPKTTSLNGKIFLLSEFFRACSKMKSAQWGFSFTKSNIHFLKQRCLYFDYMTLTV